MKNKLIYDIGMHTGRDTEFYLKKGFNVVAVEANPNLVNYAKEKFKQEIGTGQLIIIEKAIAESHSIIDFYINNDKDDWGTIVPDWNRNENSNIEVIKVSTITLEEIVKEYGMPYYMKIDIEGADVLCLKSLLKIGEIPDFLSAELLSRGNIKNRKIDYLEIISYLRVLGYRKFQISDQSRNRSIKCPNPQLEGNYVDYAFDGYCSGLFGKELTSKVYSIDEVSLEYLKYINKLWKSNNSFLTKVINKLITLIEEKKNDSVFDVAWDAAWFDIHAIKE